MPAQLPRARRFNRIAAFSRAVVVLVRARKLLYVLVKSRQPKIGLSKFLDDAMRIDTDVRRGVDAHHNERPEHPRFHV